MSWSPEDEDPPQQPRGYYRRSTNYCDCEMCTTDGATTTDQPEEQE